MNVHVNEQAASLAALNVSLLEAIAAGPAESRPALAERAGIIVTNLNRKLDSLTEHGLIVRTGEASHEVALTEAGERGLAAMAVWRGEMAPAAANPTSAELPGGIAWLPFALIDAWAMNPRTQFDPAGVEDMAQSIADQGILQPITVRAGPSGDRFEVLIGERRRRGACLAVERGWIGDDFLIPCIVRNWGDDEALDAAGVENLQRHDLHWMDEARFYLRLAERGRSGAEIARLAGESVSKRKVQDYVKIARELPEADAARAYLPDTDKARLLYVQARDLVGEKKPDLALDLSPKLAVTFLEIVNAALRRDGRIVEGRASLSIGHKHICRFAREPQSGGTLATLQHDRKLVHCSFFDFGAERREVGAQVTITEDVERWLRQIGFAADAPGTLRKLRADVLGDMIAAQLHAENRNFFAELNAPPADPTAPAVIPVSPQAKTGTQDPDAEDEDHDDDDDPADENARIVEAIRAEEPDHEPPLADYERKLIGAPAPPAAADPDDLPPMLAIVLIETAHKIAEAGVLRTAYWAAHILVDAQKDTRLHVLIRDRHLLLLIPDGQRWMVGLTREGVDWLTRWNVIDPAPDSTPPWTMHTHLPAYQSDQGFHPPAGLPYATPWLNSPSPSPQVDVGEVAAQPPEGVAPAAADHTGPPPPLPRDPEHIIGITVAALRQADHLLGRLKTSKPQPGEIDQVRTWIAAALETAGETVEA